MSEPEWTRVRPSLDQKSVIDYIITDAQLLRESGDLCIDSTDIGMSHHFLVWLELGRTAKNCRKQKRTMYTPYYICSDVVREGSRRFDALELPQTNVKTVSVS